MQKGIKNIAVDIIPVIIFVSFLISKKNTMDQSHLVTMCIACLLNGDKFTLKIDPPYSYTVCIVHLYFSRFLFLFKQYNFYSKKTDYFNPEINFFFSYPFIMLVMNLTF